MAAKVIIPIVLLLLGSKDVGAQAARSQAALKFMGRQVTVVEREREDPDGFFPKGPASICVEGPPQRQCYTAPKAFGRNPTVAVVQLEKGVSALLFSAASGGVSGWRIHFALLRPGGAKDLEDLFLSDTTVSNQSQHEFWSDSTISDAPIFVTADFEWGPNEAHYGEHRYMISAYVRQPSLDDLYYYLEDRYMTVRKYDLDSTADILASEKQETLARLRRVKTERERQRRAPR